MEYFLRIVIGDSETYVKVPEDSFFKAVDHISEKYLIKKDLLENNFGSTAIFYNAFDQESGESWDIGFVIDDILRHISGKEISK